ncbi:DNA methyltransferase (plasmid) [Kurthia gibsonii]|uniref:DNA methyltransferase n=1 Tax=Kurthia gibsonii TaxID=33946 RepID=UPI0030D07730
MSKFIALNTVSNVDLKDYTNIANSILSTVSQKLNRLYETKCPHCEGIGYIETAIWENDVITRIKGKCINDGTFIKDADGYDRSIYEEIHKEKLKLDADGSISYPKDKVLKYVKRSGKESIDELFTSRALIILSNLRNAIFEVEDEEIKSLLLFTFTSMLANVSNMLPGDIEKATYKSGWVISKFWTPKIHTERNIFHCFKLRMKAIVKGKNELLDVSQDLLTYENQDSSNLHFLEDNSIDYIFTDPPYGESIAYLALSQFWNSWLNNDVDYENEIIVDSYRNKDYIDYAQRMLNTFRELYRVLKPGHYLSFTFHNRDLNVWKSVIDAYKDAGFILQEIILQEQAVSSGTQGINKMNTLTGDFVYTLWKPFEQNSVEQNKHENRDNIEFLKQLISNIITTHKTITPSKLYEKLIPIVTKEECYFDENGKVIDIEKILKENYQYIKDESNTKLGDYYVWKIKQ